MENKVLVIPTLTEGVVWLGDLWDCKSSTAVGTLFKKPLQSQHLVAHPISTQKYNLQRAKDASDYESNMFISVELGLECAGGNVKVKGKASFERDDRKKYDQESIFCDLDVETFQVNLTGAAILDKDLISRDVLLLVGNGQLPATHYVSGVVLGGQAHATITYYQNLSKSHMDLQGSLEGTIKAGSVTASAKASLRLLDTEMADTFSTEISVSGQPGIKSAPTSCEEMFKEVEELDALIENEKHFIHTLGSNVFGVPMKFILSPIVHILPTATLSTSTYPVLSSETLSSYSEMIVALENWGYGDYIKQLVRDSAPSIVLILNDPLHPLSSRLQSLATKVSSQSEQLKEEALEIFRKVKYAEATELDMVDMVKKYQSVFPQDEIAKEISLYVEWGRNEMSAIRSSDVQGLVDEDGEPAINFFTNYYALSGWWGGPKRLQILIVPPALGKLSGREGKVFNILYKNAVRLVTLANIGVGVAFPSILEDEERVGMELKVKCPPYFQEYSYTGEDDIVQAINLLKLAIGDNMGTPEIFRNLLCVQAELDSVPLGLKELQDFSIFCEIYLQEKQEESGTRVIETLCELLAEIEGNGGTGNRLSVVFPMELCGNAVDAYANFRIFQPLLTLAAELEDETQEIVWYFSRFDVQAKLQSAPIAFVFRGKTLSCICFDSLDMAILYDSLLQGGEQGAAAAGLSLLSPESSREGCIYIEAWNYAAEVVRNCLPLQHSTSATQQFHNIEEFPPFPLIKELEEVMMLVSAFAANSIPSVFKILGNLSIKKVNLDMTLKFS